MTDTADGRYTGLGRFVPRLAVEWDLDAPGMPWRALDATLCFVDISGFTSLSERLTRRGRIGAEELTEVLNRVFGSMLALAYERGGALLKFGGDALLLMFRGEEHAAQACSAAIELRAALREAARVPTSVGRVPLRMSVGVNTGSVELFRAGRSHRELVVTGPAATATVEMEHAAGPGEIVISGSTRELLPAGAAPEAHDPGWTLRRRRPFLPSPGPRPARPVDPDAIALAIPRALRQHLSEQSAEPEHRVASVAFVRFNGVDALMALEGPRVVADAIDEIVTTVQAAVDEEGVTFLGTDIDADGGKVILVAGVPTAQDDDEGRVLRAARHIIEQPSRLPLQIGVNRGHVFAGEVGMALRSTFTIMGDTVNVAARLMAAAPHGQIYATGPVLEQARTQFATLPLESMVVKGRSAALQAYAVGSEIGSRRADDRHDQIFVGRDEELSALRRLLKSAAEGLGGAFVIDGEAGVGKSRLLREALRDDDVVVVEMRGEPYGTASPYRAVRDAARGLLGVDRGEAGKMARQLTKRVRRMAPELLPMLPMLGEITQVPVRSTPEVDAIEPQFRPDRLAETVLRLIERRRSGPLVLVVEDAQWVDEASARLLERIVEATTAHPWVVVAVRRLEPGGFTPEPADALTLEPLTRDDARRLVWAATDAAPLRPHDVDSIVTRAAGNPLFLEEMLRIIDRTGSVEALPDSLDTVVSSQIDRLQPASRRLLRTASVLGRSFRLEMLRDVLAEPADEQALEHDMELSRFLVQEGDRWRFTQGIVRDVAYEGLSYRRRRELHLRAGEATERRAGKHPEQVADLLALHYAAAEDHARAWHYSGIAAERASDAYANVEAATHYVGALSAARRLAEVPDAERVELWRGLGEVRLRMGVFDDALDAFQRGTRLVAGEPLAAAELALLEARAREQAGSYTGALRGLASAKRRLAAVDTPQGEGWRARITAYQAVVRQAQEHPDQALALARRAVEEAEAVGERRAMAQAYSVMDWALVMLGHSDEAVFGARALALYEDLGDMSAQAAMTNNLGAQAYFDGRWDEAIGYYWKSRAASERIGNAVLAAIASMNLGELFVNRGDLDDAAPLLREARQVLRASHSDAAAFTSIQLGRLLMERGRLVEAEEQLIGARNEVTALGRSDSAVEAAIHLAACQLVTGNPGDALDTIRDARRTAREESALYTAQVAPVEAEALAELDRFDDARRVAADGVVEARRQGLVYELAVVLLASASVERQAGAAGDDPAVAERTAEAFSLLERLGCSRAGPAYLAHTGSPDPK